MGTQTFRRPAWSSLVVCLGTALGCGAPMGGGLPDDPDAGRTDATEDTGSPQDTNSPQDTGAPQDTAVPPMDTGLPRDTGTPPADTGTPPLDTAPPMDTTVPRDTTPVPDTAMPPDTMVPPDAGPPPGVPVLTFGVDGQRTGANRAEAQLTPMALRGGRFGRDTRFAPALDGQVYAQPLYMPSVMVGGAARSLLFVATQANSVYALDALTGAEVWRTNLGTPVSRSSQPCGNITPTTGVLGTPAIDPVSGTLYAVSYNATGGRVFNLNALELGSGRQRAGYPVALRPPMSNGSSFDPAPTGERGALLLMNGQAYVPFGGLYGDCGYYHGWVVGVNLAEPTRQTSFATPGSGSGIWAPAGLSTDGTNLYVATGNSMRTRPGGPTSFGHGAGSLGEFVLRLPAATLSLAMADRTAQFSPADAVGLDNEDLDIGSVAPVVLPPVGGRRFVFQGGKAGTGYLLDAASLSTAVAQSAINQGMYGALAAWSNGASTYVFAPVRGRGSSCPGTGGVQALRVTASGFSVAWCTSGVSDPMASVSSNGNADGVLWVAGATAANLRAYTIADGTELWASSGADSPGSVRHWVPPVVADGRVYVTGNSAVSMYRLR